jgi:hypothetical protein
VSTCIKGIGMMTMMILITITVSYRRVSAAAVASCTGGLPIILLKLPQAKKVCSIQEILTACRRDLQRNTDTVRVTYFCIGAGNLLSLASPCL